MKRQIFEFGKGHLGFDLYEILDGPDADKLLYSSKFPVRGKVCILDDEKIKKMRRKVENTLRHSKPQVIVAINWLLNNGNLNNEETDGLN